MSRFNDLARTATISAVLVLGLSGPAAAIEMVCSNVASMQTAISGTLCCQFQNLCRFFGVSTSQCALATGPLQSCCDDPSDTEGQQTDCLCGQVAGYSNNLLGFTPEGC